MELEIAGCHFWLVFVSPFCGSHLESFWILGGTVSSFLRFGLIHLEIFKYKAIDPYLLPLFFPHRTLGRSQVPKSERQVGGTSSVVDGAKHLGCCMILS